MEKETNKKFIYILIFCFLLILIIGIILIYILMLSNSKEEISNSVNTTAIHKNINNLEIGEVYEMDTFVVNLLSQNGNKYLKIDIDIELSIPDLNKEIITKKSVIRDIFIRILSSKTFEEVSTIKGKDRLKKELITKINKSLIDGEIVNLFFTDFIVQ